MNKVCLTIGLTYLCDDDLKVWGFRYDRTGEVAIASLFGWEFYARVGVRRFWFGYVTDAST